MYPYPANANTGRVANITKDISQPVTNAKINPDIIMEIVIIKVDIF